MKLKKFICLFLSLLMTAASILLFGCENSNTSNPASSNVNVGTESTNTDTSNSSNSIEITEPYLGTWEMVGAPWITYTINYFLTEVNIVGVDEDSEEAKYRYYTDDATYSCFYSKSQDDHYTYLEMISEDDLLTELVFVLIDDNVMAICSTDLEDNVPTTYLGEPMYDKHIGVTAKGTKYYGGRCCLLVRQGTSESQIPSNADMEQIVEIYKECGASFEDHPYIYYPDCSLLVVEETAMYIEKNGNVIYAEDIGINHLNGYQSDDIFVESNLVITDNK